MPQALLLWTDIYSLFTGERHKCLKAGCELLSRCFFAKVAQGSETTMSQQIIGRERLQSQNMNKHLEVFQKC